MKHFATVTLLLLMCFISTTWPQAPTRPFNVNKRIAQFPPRAGFPQMRQPFERTRPAVPPASATKDVVWIQCPPDAQELGALCGTVPVPLDRNDPTQGTINIYFELYTHYAPGPAQSAMLFNIGGPGVTTTGNRLAAFLFLGQNLDVHDLLLIDDRGRGLSGDLTGKICTKWNERESTWRKSGSCPSRGTSQSKS